VLPPTEFVTALVKLAISDAAHNASVASTDAVGVHDLRIMVAHRFRTLQKKQL
jgi:hypothetical protein